MLANCDEDILSSTLPSKVLGDADQCRYLDQVNINNAFVSGMYVSASYPYWPPNVSRQDDLGLYHNQLNYMQTLWTVGYVIGELPSNIVLTKVPPRYWIPAMEVLWSILTFCMCKCKNAQQFYVLRFFVGRHTSP